MVDRPSGAEWATAQIQTALSDPDVTVLVAGDAPGPDQWSAKVAAVQGRYAGVFYHLDGTIRGLDGRAFARWCPFAEVPLRGSPAFWRWPLTRNAVMIRQAAARAKATGCSVRILGLLDPDSRTQGTMHTIRLARAAFMEARVLNFGEDL